MAHSFICPKTKSHPSEKDKETSIGIAFIQRVPWSPLKSLSFSFAANRHIAIARDSPSAIPVHLANLGAAAVIGKHELDQLLDLLRKNPGMTIAYDRAYTPNMSDHDGQKSRATTVPGLLDETPTSSSSQIVVPQPTSWAGATAKIVDALRHRGVRQGLVLIIGLVIVGALLYLGHRSVVDSVDSNGTGIRADLAGLRQSLEHITVEQGRMRTRLQGIEESIGNLGATTTVQRAQLEAADIRLESLADTDRELRASIRELNAKINDKAWWKRQ